MFLLASVVYILQKLGIPLPGLIANYWNDLLCIPLVLGAITYIIRHLKKDPYFQLPTGFVLLLATYYSFYFEYYLPQINPRYTADWVDVLLYFIGGMLFLVFENKKTRPLS
ncbi:hypothetical protein LPBF_08285 [Flavobacterium crassostreae]|uniref:Magnesium citrate secondary transporter n=1 Tax=Flavobacterium crassostreae TaxID=1763534 RepID=A0A1B9E0J9_9FLAO|nr:hypothetical protein LPBF_08285 [Flavobacterium crassostreae]